MNIVYTVICKSIGSPQNISIWHLKLIIALFRITKHIEAFQNCQFFSKVQCSKFISHSLTVYLFILVFPIFLFCKKIIKNSHHTEVERAQIVALHKNGLSQRQIYKKLSISKPSIKRAITKFKNKGIYGNRKKSGKHRKTTSRDDTSMKLL